MDLAKSFNSRRMKFRLLNESDIDDIYRQFSDEDMCKYFSEPPCSRNEAREIIDHYQNPEGNTYLRYGMFDIETDNFIGTCGYHYWDKELKQVELGYDIWKEYWKHGYVSEALPILIDICFEYLKVNCVYVLIHPENIASISTVRKFGFIQCEPCRKIDDEPTICMKLMR